MENSSYHSRHSPHSYPPGKNQPPCLPTTAPTSGPKTHYHPYLTPLKETEAETHTSLVNNLCNDPKHLLIYTDGLQTKNGSNGTVLVAIHANHHRLEARWNLGKHVEVYDSELFGILQATTYARKWTRDPNKKNTNTIWIFVENQAAIRKCTTPRPTAGQHLATQIIGNLNHILQNRDDIQVNIRWVPGHTEVMGNETADRHTAHTGPRKRSSRRPIKNL